MSIGTFTEIFLAVTIHTSCYYRLLRNLSKRCFLLYISYGRQNPQSLLCENTYYKVYKASPFQIRHIKWESSEAAALFITKLILLFSFPCIVRALRKDLFMTSRNKRGGSPDYGFKTDLSFKCSSSLLKYIFFICFCSLFSCLNKNARVDHPWCVNGIEAQSAG